MEFDFYIGKYPSQDGVYLDLSCRVGNKISKEKIHFASISALCDALINADIPHLQVTDIRRCLEIGHAWESDQMELRNEDLACLGVTYLNSELRFA
jgi:hypothetical protein